MLGKSCFILLCCALIYVPAVAGDFLKSAPETNKPSLNKLDPKTSTNTTRIVGGVWAKRGVYPFQAIIMVNGHFNCGGTLLRTRSHVLTAAHCLAPFQSSVENITLLFHTTVINPPDPAHYERKASGIVVHPEYNETTFMHDIGIITLSEAVPTIRTVRLEPADRASVSYVGREATVIGWGRTRQVLHPNVSSGPNSNHLRQVNLTIVNPQDCDILYYTENRYNDGRRLCASTINGKGICQGDSGGPMFIDGYQVGINSAAAGCADPRFPAVFLRVGAYRTWISEQTRSPGPKPIKLNQQ